MAASVAGGVPERCACVRRARARSSRPAARAGPAGAASRPARRAPAGTPAPPDTACDNNPPDINKLTVRKCLRFYYTDL